MKIARSMMMKAALLATLALPTLTVPAFGQQEVDPTWYNPWPANKTAAQQAPAKPPAAKNDKQAHKAKAASESKVKSAKHPAAQEPVRTAEAQPQPPQGAN